MAATDGETNHSVDTRVGVSRLRSMVGVAHSLTGQSSRRFSAADSTV